MMPAQSLMSSAAKQTPTSRAVARPMLRGVQSVLERINWILNAEGISARELGRRAGKGGSQVTMLMQRLEHGDPEGVTLRTLRELATAGRVSLAWLASGEGNPRGEGGPADPAPGRSAAAAAAKEQGIWPEAIRSVLADEVAEGEADLPAEYWLHEMRQREMKMVREGLRRDALAKRAPPPAPLPPPPAPPAKRLRRGKAGPERTEGKTTYEAGTPDESGEVRRDVARRR